MDDFGRQIGVLRRWLPLLLILVVILGGTTWLVMSLQPEVYEARSELIVRPGLNPNVGDLAVAEQLADQYANAGRVRGVTEAIIAQLGLPYSVEEFARLRTVVSELGANTIEITARSGDPGEAALIADALAAAVITSSSEGTQLDDSGTVDSYLELIRSDLARSQEALDGLLSLTVLTPAQQAERAELESRLATLQRNYAELMPFSSAYVRHRVSILEPPQVPVSPVEPRPLFWAALAMMAALLLGAAAAFVYEFANGRLHDRRDLEQASGLPVLGEVLERREDVKNGAEQRVVTARLPRSSAAESFRSVKAALEATAGDVSSLLVTGCDPDDGGAALAANLAVAYAEVGAAVLLVDGDLRSPGLHAYFGLPNDGGVAALLGQETSSIVRLAHLVRPGLAVLPAGPAATNPAEVLGSADFRRLIEQATAEADLVIVVGPSVSTYADSLIIGALVQATLLVVDAGSHFDRVRDASRRLAEAKRINIAGAVLRRYSRRPHPRQDRWTASAGEAGTAPQVPAPNPAPLSNASPGPYAIQSHQGPDGTERT